MKTVLLWLGCTTVLLFTTTQEAVTTENRVFFVTVSWLQQHIDDKDLLILDARGSTAYMAGHIPNAIMTNWQQFSDTRGTPGDKNWGNLLTAKGLKVVFQKLGISPKRKIVVYADRGGWGEDGRIVWMLQMAGFTNSKMLDGGMYKWLLIDGKISQQMSVPTASKLSTLQLNKQTNATTDFVKNNINRYKIIDVRDKKEYDGATDFGEKRGGHLPNAINIPFGTLFNDDNTLKSYDKLNKIVAKLGLSKDDSIITYCTAGLRSAYLLLVLQQLGYKNVKNYDSSFYEWAADDKLTVK